MDISNRQFQPESAWAWPQRLEFSEVCEHDMCIWYNIFDIIFLIFYWKLSNRYQWIYTAIKLSIIWVNTFYGLHDPECLDEWDKEWYLFWGHQHEHTNVAIARGQKTTAISSGLSTTLPVLTIWNVIKSILTI